MVKIVNIQNLPPTTNKPRIIECDIKQQWKRKLCECRYNKCSCSVLYYIENSVANCKSHTNSFYSAFASAYNNHEDLVLSPDDVWLQVCFHFSKFVNKYPEDMRDKIVDFADKKTLSVVTSTETEETDWKEFFDNILPLIQQNTKPNVVECLHCDFSTTTPIESIISIVSIMDSCKLYFDYERFIPMCGINNVHFMGTLDDWGKLYEKILHLKSFSEHEEWTSYIDGILPIISKFLDTYIGNVDVEWWNKIMNIRSGIYGSGKTTYISGWILKFFGLDGEIKSEEIPDYSFNVPVVIINKITNTQKLVSFMGGFSGVNDTNGAYRPQLSMLILSKATDVTPLYT
jgi:hypothetical protein